MTSIALTFPKFVDLLTDEGVQFFASAYWLPDNEPKDVLMHKAADLYSLLTEHPDDTSLEEFLTVSLSLYYKGEMTHIANFLAKAYNLPESIAADIFLVTDSVEQRNAVMLDVVYNYYLTVAEVEDTDHEKLAFTAIGLIRTFCDTSREV
jgi:hypothetical protein